MRKCKEGSGCSLILGTTIFLGDLKIREYGLEIRHADQAKVGTNFSDKLRSLGRYSWIADSSHGV
jgi:hypothetical protein